MKRAIIILVFSLILISCAPAEVEQAENQTEPRYDMSTLPTQTASEEPVVEEDVVDDSSLNVSENLTVNLDDTPELQISGSTELQGDLSLCPHLARTFECDRYDLRACRFKERIGENGYFPDHMRCRADENADFVRSDKRYCFIQECGPIVVGNLAEKYGGHVSYAEYDYREEKTADGGIMTYYNLKKCGEEWKEFDSEYDCQIYYAEWRKLWD